MADFVAVLRKTLDGIGDPTPEMRQRVYERARSTILTKLQAISPPPPQSVADRQIKALEDAIAVIERGYAGPAKSSDPLDELEDVFASLNGLKDRPTAPPRTVTPPPPTVQRPPANESRATPLAPRATPATPPTQQVQPRVATPPSREADRPQERQRPVTTPTRVDVPPTRASVNDDEALDEAAFEDERARRNAPIADDEEPRRRGFGRAIAAVLVLAALAAGGYGVWLNKDDFSRLVGLTPPETATTPLQTEPSPPAEDLAATAPAEPEPAAAAPAAPEPAAAAPAAGEPAPKLTQRLNEDGSEVDAGPASGAPSVGEGTSVAEVTPPTANQPDPITAPPASETPAPPPAAAEPAVPPAAEPPAVATPPAETPPAAAAPPTDTAAAEPAAPTPGAPAAPAPDAPAPATPPPAATAAVTPPAAEPTLAVGQKAIFYEERTSSAQGSAEPGATVWSLVQESPGGDRPPEPAIHGEATIPGKEVQVRVTIRRNADPTLPASHIVEMIFLTPEGFEGGGVDNVLRMALKSSEQDAGSPLIGIPAKIADGFFLIALNDNKAEIDANMNLLLQQSWIDIPIVYKSGRRALITMEKGVPGEKVFDDALKAWGVASAG